MDRDEIIAGGVGLLIAGVITSQVAAQLNRVSNGIFRLDYVPVRPGTEKIQGKIYYDGKGLSGATVRLSQVWLNRAGAFVGDIGKASVITTSTGDYVMFLSTISRAPLPTTPELPGWTYLLSAISYTAGAPGGIPPKYNRVAIEIKDGHDVICDMEVR
jgi:hypothetical protein